MNEVQSPFLKTPLHAFVQVYVFVSTSVPAYICSHLTEAYGGRLTMSGNLARIHSISFFPLG